MSFSGNWNRYGCCMEDEPNEILNEEDSLVIELFGTIYRTIPQFYTPNGKQLYPVDFKTNHMYGHYYWKFFKNGINGVLMSTSDDILSNVLVNKKEASMKRIQRHNGRTLWEISTP